jgi:hypothetical protein
MKVTSIAFPTLKYPCFGFVICSDGKSKYLPEYNNDDVVEHFEKTVFDTMFLVEIKSEFSINTGDKRIYAYRIDDDNVYIGDYENIKINLHKDLHTIKNAPFSKLEVADFIGLSESEMRSVLSECYLFLLRIDANQAHEWADKRGISYRRLALSSPFSCRSGFLSAFDSFDTAINLIIPNKSITQDLKITAKYDKINKATNINDPIIIVCEKQKEGTVLFEIELKKAYKTFRLGNIKISQDSRLTLLGEVIASKMKKRGVDDNHIVNYLKNSPEKDRYIESSASHKIKSYRLLSKGFAIETSEKSTIE